MSADIQVSVVKYPDRSALMLRWKDPITNRMKTRSAKTSNQREAQKLAGELEAQLRDGQDHSPLKITWAVFRERYETEYGLTLSAASREKNDTTLDAVERILRPVRVADLTSEKLSHFVSVLRSEEHGGKGKQKRIGRSEATIGSYISHLKAVLAWGVEAGLIRTMPKLKKSARAKSRDAAKGRAITEDEFGRLLNVIPKGLKTNGTPGTPIEISGTLIESWEFYLRGLWFSGFRLGESLNLSWSDESRPRVDLSGRRPVVRFPSGSQKSGKAETWPCPPEFAELLQTVPESERQGPVFKLVIRDDGLAASEEAVMRAVVRMGKAAEIVVSRSADGKRLKHASAHDLRRSFCTRWARRVMPQVLTRLARHAHIATTMAYYVTRDAEDTADAVWDAYERLDATKNNSFGNTPLKTTKDLSQRIDSSPCTESISASEDDGTRTRNHRIDSPVL